MDLVYRMHTVSFDPKDEEQIIQNWEWILDALSYSSNSLRARIGNRSYLSLSTGIKEKIYKYLLRGRFRSTPFGLWAGVGTASWGTETSSRINQNYHPISLGFNSNELPENTEDFRLAPGVEVFDFHVKFWSYSSTEEGWRMGYLERNRIINLLINRTLASQKISLSEFRKFFRNGNAGEIERIWQIILDSGLLIPILFPKSEINGLENEPRIDIKMESKPILNRSIQYQLDSLIREMGSLFVPIESSYQNEFKRWFLKKFDDRFVPLLQVSKDLDFLIPFPEEQLTNPNKSLSEKAIKIWDKVDELDLRQLVEIQPVTLPEHLQFVFKVGQADEIFIENIVCNRPYAYGGRFTLDSEIKETISNSSPSQSEIREAVYADLFMYESTKSNFIMRHSNAYSYSIFPFGPSIGDEILGVNDLELGIQEDRLILYSQKLKKTVIPVIHHPLNPEQISHPLSRLLWEIGNQDQVKFSPYYLSSFQSSSYLPRLKWGKAVIQGRRWRFSPTQFPSQKSFEEHLTKSAVPERVLAGHLDRELVLDWREPADLKLLWNELQRQSELELFECPWSMDTAFSSEKGSPLFPQFIYGVEIKGNRRKHPEFYNCISDPDLSWVYARIFIKNGGEIPYLKTCLSLLIQSVQEEYSIGKWYYLVYNSPNFELRLRFELKEEAQRPRLEEKLRSFNLGSGWIRETEFSLYFPEKRKYGDFGIKDSEEIFTWESEFLVMGRGGLSEALSKKDDSVRLEFLLQMFEGVILKTEGYRQIFEHLKARVKKIPHETKKGVGNFCPNRFSKPCIEIQEEYFGLYSRHACFAGSQWIFILFHHLHMFCNRAFPIDPLTYEEKLIILLYKRLGKQIYKGQQKDFSL